MTQSNISAGISEDPVFVALSWSHAGPDRAATATDGIASWWPRRQRNLSAARGWGKERCCKSGLESGANLGCAGADGRPSGAARMKIVSQCREQVRRVNPGALFEIKKEISIKGKLNVIMFLSKCKAIPANDSAETGPCFARIGNYTLRSNACRRASGPKPRGTA